ncbi:MAG: hypothetical protein AMXMBFR7_23630 [Planctomycetota bacterium]
MSVRGLLLFTAVLCGYAGAAEYYVSAKGSGKAGTKEAPAKDLGYLLASLKAGDTIHMAEGVYVERSEKGAVTIEVPVTIIGGYDEGFTKRDPWGAHRTILSGVNTSVNLDRGPRLSISLKKIREPGGLVKVDGLIIDSAGRNRYAGEGAKIVRKANPAAKENPTPDSAGLSIELNEQGEALVENCIVMNCAPTGGALNLWGYKSTKATVRNCLVINNTGVGIACLSRFQPKEVEGRPAFLLERNTVLFTEKYDAFGTIAGDALNVDAVAVVTAKRNVFAFSDRFGVNNQKQAALTLAENLFRGNLFADYCEFDTKMGAAAMADDADKLTPESTGNVTQEFQAPVGLAWGARYMSRNVIDRNVAEADVKAKDTVMNEWRKILGLPLDGGTLKVDSEIWLPKMDVETAVTVGSKAVLDGYGCSKPAP